MNENCFAQAVIELECSCPLLLDVLAACLGHYVCDENKVTMIGTIYGMILHARNKQISAVQRIYTALAIQCHADNKCSFQYLRTSYVTKTTSCWKLLMSVKHCSRG